MVDPEREQYGYSFGSIEKTCLRIAATGIKLTLDRGSWRGKQTTINGRAIDLVAGYGWGREVLDMVIVATAGVYDYDGGSNQFPAGDWAAIRPTLSI